MTMNLVDFTKHIERVQKAVTDSYSLSDLLKTDVIEFSDDLVDSITDLLVIHFNDKSEWISYWMWELDFGVNYTDGSVTFDDVPVPLKTIEDLYKVLIDNMKE